MLRKTLNILLNIVISPKIRFKKCMTVGSDTVFLRGFNIIGGFNNKMTIGNQSIVGGTFIFEHKEGLVTIGDRVYIGSSTIICKNKVIFENDILVAWGVTFYDHNSHSLDYKERQKDIVQTLHDYKNHNGNYLFNKNWIPVDSKPIIVKSNAWIGFDATILKGVTIGEGAIVAACSVVTKDVPPYTVVAGNPAKVVRHLIL